jgi:hypothetical protein
MAREGGDKVSIIGTADINIKGPLGQDTGVNSVSVVQASDSYPNADYAPQYEPSASGGSIPGVDPAGQLLVRGPTLTDEGGYTTNFSGSQIYLDIGTCTFTNGSDEVTWTHGTQDIAVGEYIKLSTDADSAYKQIAGFTDSIIYLSDTYAGTGGTGTGYSVVEKPVVGAGATFTNLNGQVIISAGTTATSIIELERDLDVFPVVIEKELSISQRIANQDIYVGLYDEAHVPARHYAWFHFSGTDASKVITETAHSRTGTPTAYDIETNTVTLPTGVASSQLMRLRIEVEQSEHRFILNDVVVARHRRVLMKPTSFLTNTVRIVNGTTPATDTSVTMNYSRAYNYNKLSVGLTDKDSVLFSNDTPREDVSAIPVRVAPAKTWRTTFSKALSNTVDPQFFTLKQTGTNQTVNQTGGNLVLVSGTTSNAETVIRSNRSWSDSWAMRYCVVASQRIAAQSLFVEMVDVIGDLLACTINSATSVTVTIPGNPFTSENVGQSMYIGVINGAAGVPGRYAIASVSGNTVTFTVAGWPASGSCTVSLFGWNYHHVVYDSTTATNAKYDAQRMGWAGGDTTATIQTTVSPGHVAQVLMDDHVATYSDALRASATGYQWSQRASKIESLPNVESNLYLQIRNVNGTSPATTGTWTISMVSVDEFAPAPVTIKTAHSTGGSNALPVQVMGGSISATATGVAGAGAHDATISGNPVRTAGRAMTSNYSTVATGETADYLTTTVGVQVTRDFSIPELEFGAIDSITNTATAVQIRPATASNLNYVTGLTIQSATLGGATVFQLRSTPVASTTATISSNTLVMAATYGWKVGDLVYVTASTVTGLSAGSYYYILTVSGANLTFSATRGGGTLAISGTSVVATLAKVLYRTTLQTTALPLTVVQFQNPLSGGINLAIEAVTLTGVTGIIDLNVQGYVAP